MKSKPCVVVQGKTYDVSRMNSVWDGVDIIYSAWKGEEHLYSDNDLVIFNNIPEDEEYERFNLEKSNLVSFRILLQIKSSLSGILLAEELGYDFAVKWRSDWVPSDGKKLLSYFKTDCLNFIAWSTHNNGYFVDYWYGGPVDLLKEILQNNSALSVRSFAERRFTNSIENLKNKHGLTKINFLLNNIDESCNCVYIKPDNADRTGYGFPLFNTNCLNPNSPGWTPWDKDHYWDNSWVRDNSWPI